MINNPTITVHIPDANFKAALLADPKINPNQNTEILRTEAQAFSGSIDVSGKNIAILVGIEAFTALTTLNCSSNQLKTLDVSCNKALSHLYCFSNQLTTLDVSNNKALTTLNCSSNQLKTLDVSNNKALTTLNCSSNQLTILNVKNGNNRNMLFVFDDNFDYFSGECNFNATNNPNLTCIQVDNTTYSNNNWLKKDAIATYKTKDCK